MMYAGAYFRKINKQIKPRYFENSWNIVGECESLDCDFITDRCCNTPLHRNAPIAPGDECYFIVVTCPNDSLIYPQNENYMYYNPDECLNMFSLDQRIRMRAALSSIRAELCSPENLEATGARLRYSYSN